MESKHISIRRRILRNPQKKQEKTHKKNEANLLREQLQSQIREYCCSTSFNICHLWMRNTTYINVPFQIKLFKDKYLCYNCLKDKFILLLAAIKMVYFLPLFEMDFLSLVLNWIICTFKLDFALSFKISWTNHFKLNFSILPQCKDYSAILPFKMDYFFSSFFFMNSLSLTII